MQIKDLNTKLNSLHDSLNRHHEACNEIAAKIDFMASSIKLDYINKVSNKIHKIKSIIESFETLSKYGNYSSVISFNDSMYSGPYLDEAGKRYSGIYKIDATMPIQEEEFTECRWHKPRFTYKDGNILYDIEQKPVIRETEYTASFESRDINYIEFDPAGEFPFDIVVVKYFDGSDWVTLDKSIGSVYDTTRVYLGLINTSAIVFKVIQKECSATNRYITPDNLLLIKDLIDNNKNFVSFFKENNTNENFFSSYLYSHGFDSIKVGLIDYKNIGFKQSNTVDVKAGVIQCILKADDYNNSDVIVNYYLYKQNYLNGKKTNLYIYPVLPEGVSKARQVIPSDNFELMFKISNDGTDYDIEIYTNESETPLVINTDYTIENNMVVKFTSFDDALVYRAEYTPYYKGTYIIGKTKEVVKHANQFDITLDGDTVESMDIILDFPCVDIEVYRSKKLELPTVADDWEEIDSADFTLSGRKLSLTNESLVGFYYKIIMSIEDEHFDESTDHYYEAASNAIKFDTPEGVTSMLTMKCIARKTKKENIGSWEIGNPVIMYTTKDNMATSI